MKTHCTAVAFAVASLLSNGPVQGQVIPLFWGMTPSGGTFNKGTLFSVDGEGTEFEVHYQFDDSSGYAPEGTLCLASNGKLYGTTNLGGSGVPGAGTLFSFDPGGGGFEKLVDFDLANGGFGWGGMITGPDGLLYGATYGGGGTGGSIYRVDPNDDSYSIRYALNEAIDGGAINNRLLLGTDGLLYGAASQGGVNGAGTIFSFDPATDLFTKLHDFDGAGQGSTPYGQLCEAGNGLIYGTTYEGGVADQGTFFSYDTGTGTFAKLLDFDGDNGQSPWNGPVSVAPDLLYGTATLGGSAGGGALYSYVPSTGSFTEAYSFNSLDGGLLFGGILPFNEKFYGMSAVGGTHFVGNVYRFDPATGQVSTLHSFDSATDGSTPRGDLVQAGTVSGIGEHLLPVSFSVYPNPTLGPVNVLLDKQVASASLHITNSMGRSVATYTLHGGSNTVHLPGAPGLYWFTVEEPGSRSTQVVLME